MLQLTFNPGLTLTSFRKTRPSPSTNSTCTSSISVCGPLSHLFLKLATLGYFDRCISEIWKNNKDHLALSFGGGAGDMTRGDSPVIKAGVLVLPFRVFGLKRSTARAFATPFRILSRQK